VLCLESARVALAVPIPRKVSPVEAEEVSADEEVAAGMLFNFLFY